MSTLKVNAIRGTGASSDAVTLASDGSCIVKATNNLSNRNKLYNPDLKIWQRGTSFSPTTSAIYGADRWNNAIGSSFNGDTTVTRSTDVPANSRTSYSIKIEADAAVTPTGGQNMVFRQILEGQDLQDFDFGTSSAQSLVASFWCKCNATAAGAYSFSPRFMDSSGNGYGQIHTFTPTTSWVRYTFVLAANGKALDTAIRNDNQMGFEFAIHLADGPDDQSSASSTWAAQAWYGTGAKNFMDNAANEIYFTGFQLETGDKATDLEVRSYGDEFARCQRYYYRMASGTNKYLASGGYYTSGLFACVFSFPTTMRTTPTLDYLTGTDRYLIFREGASDGVNALSLVQPHENGGGFDVTNGASGTQGVAGFLGTNNNDIHVSFTAEL